MKKLILLSLLTILFSLTRSQEVLAQTPSPTEGCHTIVVRAGDTLNKISQQYYNDPLAYEAIIEATNTKAVSDASYPTITNPMLLNIGWKLCLPNVQKIKIAVVYHQAGAMKGYADPLTKGINIAFEQIEESRDFLPIELITAQMSNNQEQNQKILNQLVKQEPIAIIAPYLSLSLITSPTIPLEHHLFNTQPYNTFGLAEIGSDEHQANLSSNNNTVLNQTLKKLKFDGKLQHSILMYDPIDSFSQWGSQLINKTLSYEQVQLFSSQDFETGKEDFRAKLKQLKFLTPNATLFISASEDEVKRVIRAYHKISLKNQLIALTEETHPAIFDLADSNQDKTLLGIPWHITTILTESQALPLELHNDRFAAQTYLALWTLVTSVDDKNPTGRVVLRRRLDEINESNLIQLYNKDYFYFDKTKKLRKLSQKTELQKLLQWRYRKEIKAQ